MAVCSCSGDWNNLGSPSCFGEAGEFLNAVFATELNSSGAKNCVLGTDTLDQSFWDGKFKAESMQDRWLVLEGISKVTPITEDDITDTSNPLKTITLSKGRRGYTFSVVTKEPNKLASQFEALACQELVFYAVTDNNNLVGQCIGNDLCGRKIARLTTTVLNKSTQNGQAGELLITVEFELTETDSKVDYVSAGAGVTLTDSKALIDVNIEWITSSTTEAVFKLTTNYGPKNDRVTAQGLTETELEIYNVTDAGVVALTGPIAENNGTYTATFTSAQDVSDVIRVQGITTTVQKNFDLKYVDDVTATIS